MKRRGTIQPARFEFDRKEKTLVITEYFHDNTIRRTYFKQVGRQWMRTDADNGQVSSILHRK